MNCWKADSKERVGAESEGETGGEEEVIQQFGLVTLLVLNIGEGVQQIIGSSALVLSSGNL